MTGTITPDAPELHVRLELEPDMAVGLGQDGLAPMLPELGALLATLGIPGSTAVTVAPAPEETGRLPRLTVDGRPVQAGPLQEAASRVTAGMVPPAVLGLAALEAIRDDPSVLFGPDQATAYQRQLGAGASDVARLRNILTAVLDLRLSIADRVTVARILSDDARETDPTEDLIDALAPDDLHLHLHPDYLRDLTEADPRNEADLFSSVREQLFLKLGITPPRCCFVMDESLPPQTFAFGLNHLRTPVLPGLPPPGPDEADNVRLAINEAIAQGWVPRPWDPPMHLVVALAARLHAHASCFLTRRTVGAQLDQLELAFPELVQATRALISVEQVARVLRELVLHQVSVRNLRGILEQMLDYADTSEPW